MENEMNYETIAVMDIVLNNIDIMNKIKEAHDAGMHSGSIATELQLFFCKACPATGFEVYDNLLDHAIEQVDFEMIVNMVLQEKKD